MTGTPDAPRRRTKPAVTYGASSGPTLVPPGGSPSMSLWAPLWYAFSGSLFVLFAVSVVDRSWWRAIGLLCAMLVAAWTANRLTRR